MSAPAVNTATRTRAPFVYAPPAPAESRPTTHLLQLDGLRCIAVLFVVWQHAGAYAGARQFLVHGFGIYGVWLFFTLSAFLITRIVLQLRDRELPLGAVARSFYLRRVLRIVPAYYLFLALAAGLSVPFAPGELASHLTYLTPQIALTSEAWPRAAQHLWSLAVEEQFYLIWPWILLVLPRTWAPRVLVGTLVGALLLRWYSLVVTNGDVLWFLQTTGGAVDPFAIGALLGWHWHTRPEAAEARARAIRRGLIAGGVLLVVSLCAIATVADAAWWFVLEAPVAGIAAAWLVNRAAIGFTGSPGAILSARPTVYLGKISYGIYLYHTLVIWVLALVGQAAERPAAWATEGTYPYLGLVVGATIIVASLSWRYVESPLLSLKSRLQAPSPAPALASA